jgi:hypothetical protein
VLTSAKTQCPDSSVRIAWNPLFFCHMHVSLFDLQSFTQAITRVLLFLFCTFCALHSHYLSPLRLAHQSIALIRLILTENSLFVSDEMVQSSGSKSATCNSTETNKFPWYKKTGETTLVQLSLGEALTSIPVTSLVTPDFGTSLHKKKLHLCARLTLIHQINPLSNGAYLKAVTSRT